jgi:dTDP-4-amino-4,6-dideoxy-D-galactose acyltransferase
MNRFYELRPFFERNTKAVLHKLEMQTSEESVLDYCAHFYSSAEWGFVTVDRPAVMGIVGLRPLKWDSEIYGVKIGSIGITGLSPEVDDDQKNDICSSLVQAAKEYAISNKFDLLICRIPLTELVWIQTLEKFGFFTADVQCPLIYANMQSISLPTRTKVETVIREARPQDFADISSFGKTAFGKSHLYTDSKLPTDLSDKLHEEWLKNDILKNRAKFTLVAELNGKIIGFISTLWDEVQQKIFGFGHGHIDLMAVHWNWQGYGVGRLLLSRALERLSQEGASRVTVSTQATNLNAIRLYQQAGFTLSGFEITLHAWLS